MSRFAQLLLTFITFGFSNVVINEIHYNPSLNLGFEDADYEFVELYNNSDHDIDITDWSFASSCWVTLEQGTSAISQPCEVKTRYCYCQILRH